MVESTNDNGVMKQITDNLQSYQSAAQQLMGMLGQMGAASRPAEGGDEPPHHLPTELVDFQYLSGLQQFAATQVTDFAAASQRMMNLMFQKPEQAYQQITRFWTEQFRIYAGVSGLTPDRGDHRFDDPSWTANPIYKQAMQTHLSVRKCLDDWVEGLDVEHKEAEQLRFAVTLLTDALAPSNWPTNPAALKRHLETQGESAIRGIQNFVDDILHNNGMPSMVKRGALKVGVDMGNSPGKVVHRTEVFELIQYAPSTGEVYGRPFLMVPPQINKFYFYDLSPKKSLIRFAVESGLQVFTLSWRNPTQEHRDWNFDTYIGAIEEAMEVICEITDSPDLNIEGGCVAGITVVGLLGSLAERGVRKVNSATLMVTTLDTSAETQLGSLASPAMLELADMNTSAKGVMDGAEMGRVFAMLRPNELIWNYWVNNYLLGNDPPTFDVLAWNADTSRMAGGLHHQILGLVKDNSLAKGEFEVHGKPVRLKAIDCDQFWLAGSTDHITPWRACYSSTKLVGGKREFVLSDGGHIQSMVSSPANRKAKFHVSTKQPKDPDAWLEGATEHDSSWWLYWRDWITKRSGELQKAPETLGSAQHPALTDAPGTYVFE